MSTDPAYSAVAAWFGSNRMLAHHVGTLLEGCTWVGVPFAGGMSELLHIRARSIVANDLHRHVVNLAKVMADEKLGPQLYRELRRMPLHPEVLADSQAFCRVVQPADEPDLECAFNYFICAWMGRNGKAGTAGEFKGGISVRYDDGGGDSAIRFRNATASIPGLRRMLRRCTFDAIDFRRFLAKCKDEPNHGIYCDPPFPGPGDGYRHKFTIQDQTDLAELLQVYRQAKVVIRYYDVPLIRSLYPEPHWHWLHLKGRKATNAEGPEVLITNLAS